MNKKTEKGRLALVERLGEKFTQLTEYVDYYDTEVTLVCNTCNYTFSMRPVNIRKATTCPLCNRGTWDSGKIQKILDKYDVGITVVSDYLSEQEDIICKCNTCDYEWPQKPKSVRLKRKPACPACFKKVKGSIEKVKSLLLEKGHTKVDVIGDYVNNSTPIECYCRACETTFYPVAATLLYGSGCPFCCFKGRIPRNRPASLYYVRIDDEGGSYWKVGITTKSDILERFSRDMKYRKITLLYSFLFENGADAYYCEKNILRLYKKYIIPQGTKVLIDGNTEIFCCDVLQMNHLEGSTNARS